MSLSDKIFFLDRKVNFRETRLQRVFVKDVKEAVKRLMLSCKPFKEGKAFLRIIRREFGEGLSNGN